MLFSFDLNCFWCEIMRAAAHELYCHPVVTGRTIGVKERQWLRLLGPTHDCVRDWAEFSERSVFGSFCCSSALLAACVHASQPQHCSCFTQCERSGEAGVWGSTFVPKRRSASLPGLVCLCRWLRQAAAPLTAARGQRRSHTEPFCLNFTQNCLMSGIWLNLSAF